MSSHNSSKHLWVWPMVLLFAVGTGVFTDLSGTPFYLVPHIDKVAHTLYLALFATLLARQWPVWAVIISGIIVSVGIELGQMLTPPRTPDLDDALWGVVGTLLGWAFYQIKFYKKFLEYKLF